MFRHFELCYGDGIEENVHHFITSTTILHTCRTKKPPFTRAQSTSRHKMCLRNRTMHCSDAAAKALRGRRLRKVQFRCFLSVHCARICQQEALAVPNTQSLAALCEQVVLHRSSKSRQRALSGRLLPRHRQKTSPTTLSCTPFTRTRKNARTNYRDACEAVLPIWSRQLFDVISHQVRVWTVRQSVSALTQLPNHLLQLLIALLQIDYQQNVRALQASVQLAQNFQSVPFTIKTIMSDMLWGSVNPQEIVRPEILANEVFKTKYTALKLLAFTVVLGKSTTPRP